MNRMDVAKRTTQINEILQISVYDLEKNSLKIPVRVKKDILAGKSQAWIVKASPSHGGSYSEAEVDDDSGTNTDHTLIESTTFR